MDPVNYKIQTFGCKVNTYDTGLLQKRLSAHGFLESSSGQGQHSLYTADFPQVHILNTCAVTAEATREAKRVARRLKRKNPESLVVLTGCAAQVDTDELSSVDEADLIVANSHKGDLEDLIFKKLRGELTERVFKSNIFKKLETEPGGGIESHHTRTFLKIQDGCNSFCTFCVIPFARGKSRSLSIDELVQRTNDIHGQGIDEVVLTGVHIGDYESEWPESLNAESKPIEKTSKKAVLEDLIEQLLLRTQVPRFRLTSLEPIELSDRLFELYKNERMCPHFHMSIQAANTKVLHDMKRKYGQKEVRESLERIERELPHAFVGMDVIAGFVGETDEEFEDTYETLKSLPWTQLHVFPYSERPGTFASRMSGLVPEHIVRQRAARLRELSSERFAEKALEQVGTTKKVLLLNKKNSKGELQGLSRDYWRVHIDQNKLSDQLLAEQGDALLKGEVTVRIKGYDHSLESRTDGYLSASITG